ncbi:protein angel homolog 2 [Bradysia coprophila]|uniref:protein angel homolog 2 n=1 Tax=Bradysia coprophila TaxID=38358 RepID=UPI00187DB646|nr:protein angel homolog 2 [Bradysia coprophila]
MLKLLRQNFVNHSFSVNLFHINVRSTTSNKSSMDNSGVERQWIKNPSYQNYKPKADETEITVMSYNLLAQDLIDKHTYLYSTHNGPDLTYHVRSQRLINEMKRIRPDILCLQEMQESHVMDFKLKCFSIDLQELIFKKRTQDDLTDGCAIFFNSDLLELVSEEKVEYFQPNVHVLNRPNVAIVAKFRLRTSPYSELVVATTHLLYNPRRQDVRLAQVQVLLAEIDRIAYQGIDEHCRARYSPVILTGDFNFQPNTAPYSLIVNGYLTYSSLSKRLQIPRPYEPKFGDILLPIELGITDDCQHFDRNVPMLHSHENHTSERAIAPVEKLYESQLPFQTGMLKHRLNFGSVYDDAVSASTYQDQWVLVDYIFYRRESTMTNHSVEKNIKLVARFELPSREQCYYHLPYGGIPNASQGSDHFALAAKFLVSFSDDTR